MRAAIRGLGLGLGLALLCIGSAAVALAHCRHYGTEIRKPTVRQHPPAYGGRLVVATQLSSAFRGCEVYREVTLYQENGSIDVKVDTARTDSGGRVVFSDYGKQAFYYVRAEKKTGNHYVCPSRRSVVSSAF